MILYHFFIQKARKLNDERLREQQRNLRIQRSQQHQLQQQHLEMRRNNELLKIRKQIVMFICI